MKLATALLLSGLAISTCQAPKWLVHCDIGPGGRFYLCKDESSGYTLGYRFTANRETAVRLPSFEAAFRLSRMLVAVDGDIQTGVEML